MVHCRCRVLEVLVAAMHEPQCAPVSKLDLSANKLTPDAVRMLLPFVDATVRVQGRTCCKRFMTGAACNGCAMFKTVCRSYV